MRDKFIFSIGVIMVVFSLAGQGWALVTSFPPPPNVSPTMSSFNGKIYFRTLEIEGTCGTISPSGPLNLPAPPQYSCNPTAFVKPIPNCDVNDLVIPQALPIRVSKLPEQPVSSSNLPQPETIGIASPQQIVYYEKGKTPHRCYPANPQLTNLVNSHSCTIINVVGCLQTGEIFEGGPSTPAKKNIEVDQNIIQPIR
jgi:hypothetical protein